MSSPYFVLLGQEPQALKALEQLSYPYVIVDQAQCLELEDDPGLLHKLIPLSLGHQVRFLALDEFWSDLALNLRAYHRPELKALCYYAQADSLFLMRKKLRAAGFNTVMGLEAGSTRAEMLALGFPLSLRPLKARVEAVERWEWPTQLPDYVPTGYGLDHIPFAQKVWAHDFIFHGQSMARFWTEVCIPGCEYITPMPMHATLKARLEHVHFQLIQILPQLEHYCGFLNYSLYIETRAVDCEIQDFQVQLDRISLELPNALWMQIFQHIFKNEIWLTYFQALNGVLPRFPASYTSMLGLRYLSSENNSLQDWGPILFAEAVPGVVVLNIENLQRNSEPWPQQRDYLIFEEDNRIDVLSGMDSVLQIINV